MAGRTRAHNLALKAAAEAKQIALDQQARADRAEKNVKTLGADVEQLRTELNEKKARPKHMRLAISDREGEVIGEIDVNYRTHDSLSFEINGDGEATFRFTPSE